MRAMSLSRILRFDTHTARLRAIAFLEGLSFVALVFLAVPVKYVGGDPLLVRIIGPIHGGLFLTLAYLVYESVGERGKPTRWGARVVFFALLPLGAFFLDRGLAEDDEAYRQTQT